MKMGKCKPLFMVLAAAVLCIMAGMFTSPMKSEAATKAKVVLEFSDGTKKTWKTGNSKIRLGKKKLAYVCFGEYPQTEVTGKRLTGAIKNAKYGENGIATVNGVKYKRIQRADVTYIFDSSDRGYTSDHYYDWAGKTYAYFKLEPIKWRVLSYKNGSAVLMSEYGLDDQKYNEKNKKTTWEKCTLRTWLNSTFLKSAFNARERKLIKTTTLVNANNSLFNTKGGNNTKDKIYLLSYDEMINNSFDEKLYGTDISSCCSSTDYAKSMGSYTAYGDDDWSEESCRTAEGNWTCYWWLRSPGEVSSSAAYMEYSNGVNGYGFFVERGDIAVRPVLQLNLSSVIG